MKYLAGFCLGLLFGIAIVANFRNVAAGSDDNATGQSEICTTRCGIADMNGDGLENIRDPIHLLEWLFGGGPPPVACEAGTEPARTRFQNDLLCNGNAFATTLSFCGTEVMDDAADGLIPSDCVELPDASECLVEVTADVPDCGEVSICGTIPIREGYSYDVVLTVSGNGPTVLWYEQELTLSANCPLFPVFGSPSTGFFFDPCTDGAAIAPAPSSLWTSASGTR